MLNVQNYITVLSMFTER